MASDWVGLAGVIVGAALGYASSTVQDGFRRRHESAREQERAAREDRIRLQDRAFDAFVAVTTAANRLYAVVKHPAVVPGAAVDDGVSSDGLRFRPIFAAYEDFTAALSPSFLLASSWETHDALAALARANRNLVEGATDPTGVGSETMDALLHAHRQAVKEAEAATRAALGLEALTGPLNPT